MMSKDWTDKIGERMDKHCMEAPEGLWERIEQAMADRQQAIVKRHRRLLYLKQACAAAAIVGVVSIVAYCLKRPLEERVIAAVESLPQHSAGSLETAMASQSEQPFLQSSLLAQTASPVQHRTMDADTTQTALNDSNKPQTATFSEPSEAASATAQPQTKTKPTNTNSLPSSFRNGRSIGSKSVNENEQNIVPTRRKRTGWGGGLYASSLGASSAVEPTSAVFMYPQYTNFVMGYKTQMKLHHQTPIRIGLSLAYRFNDRLAAETGAVYTYLHSDYNNADYRYEQTLHYVGIPLRIVCNVWSFHHFSLYAAAGVVAEKCVGGHSKESYSTDKASTFRYSLSEKKLQWSANATAGVQYSITRTIGLYVEPGVSHHFDNGSSLSNIYKDSPTRFNLQFGLRFTP